MRVLVLAAALAATAAWAQETPPPAETPPAETPAPAAPETPAEPPAAPPADAPQAAAQCSIDRDCPGALVCQSGQCVAAAAPAEAADVKVTPAKPQLPVKQFGINLDAGVPDGLALGVLFRPIPFVRMGAAATYNALSFGGRGTVTVTPFSWIVTPSVSLEAGHYFAADVTLFVEQTIGQAIPPEVAPLLREVAYNYGNAHVGLEIGPPQTFQIFIRVGGSYIQSKVNNFGEVLQATTGDPNIEAEDLIIRLTAPSLKLGVVAYF